MLATMLKITDSPIITDGNIDIVELSAELLLFPATISNVEESMCRWLWMSSAHHSTLSFWTTLSA